MVYITMAKLTLTFGGQLGWLGFEGYVGPFIPLVLSTTYEKKTCSCFGCIGDYY